MLKKFTVVLGALAIATPAFAVSVITNQQGAPDPGVPLGLTTVIDFDTVMNPLVVNTQTGNVYTGSATVSGQYAKPADPLNADGNYQAVQTNGTSTFDFTNVYDDGRALGRFSLYWGSIDTYNTLSFLKADGTLVKSFTGVDFPPANGSQPAALTNRRITFGFSQADAVTKVRFASSQNAFEFDTLAIAAVPEPASWAMLIAGFGLIGATMRRRRQQIGSVLA
jgi:hypothetical protein